MKKLIVFILITGVVLASTLPLSQEKLELLKLERQKIQQDINRGEKSWISPLSLSASLSKSQDATETQSEMKSAGLGWNQDIFRSGGIYYTIDQAKALGQVNLLGVDINEALYLKQAYTLKAQIERDRLLYKQNELTLKNSNINLFITTAKYKAGNSDITDLNNATISRDTARTNLISTKNTLSNEIYGLKQLVGNKKIDTIILPNIPLISQSKYLQRNLELLQYKAKDKNNDASWKITRASYLPKLTLNGSVGYSNYQGNIMGYSGNSYSYGVTLSMLLDINSKATVESARLQYLQTRTAEINRKQELEQQYKMIVETIANYKEKIGVAQEMTSMYNDLYSFTDAQVKAGSKSTYDLESLGNSLKIQKLEKKIQVYNIIIEKISLYFDTKQ